MGKFLIDWLQQSDQVKLDFIRRYDKAGWSPIENITHLPYIYVKRDIPNFIQESNFDEAFSLTLAKPISEVLKIPPLERFRLLIWLENQYKIINAIEEKYLVSPPDIKMIAAGIRDLDPLGVLNVTAMISRDFNYTIEQVEMLPFEKVFDLQLLMKRENEIKNRYYEQNKPK